MIKNIILGILVLLLSIKLYSLITNDIETLRGFIFMDRAIAITNLKYFFSDHAIFFDSILVSICLAGIFIKGKVGLTLTLLWPYSLIILAIIFLNDIDLWGINKFDIYWSFTIIIITNIKPVQEYFRTNLRQQIYTNLFSMVLAICLMALIYYINVKYLR